MKKVFKKLKYFCRFEKFYFKQYSSISKKMWLYLMVWTTTLMVWTTTLLVWTITLLVSEVSLSEAKSNNSLRSLSFVWTSHFDSEKKRTTCHTNFLVFSEVNFPQRIQFLALSVRLTRSYLYFAYLCFPRFPAFPCLLSVRNCVKKQFEPRNVS